MGLRGIIFPSGQSEATMVTEQLCEELELINVPGLVAQLDSTEPLMRCTKRPSSCSLELPTYRGRSSHLYGKRT